MPGVYGFESNRTTCFRNIPPRQNLKRQSLSGASRDSQAAVGDTGLPHAGCKA